MKYKNLEYLIRYPKDYREGEKYPVIFYIHGAGGRGNQISAIENNPLFSGLRKLEEERFVAVAPQCFADTWFEIFEQLTDFIRYVISCDFADKRRIYLSGSSMGAYTSWQLAMTMNHTFAALVAVCGGGMYWNAQRIRHLPIRAFHGALDDVVLPEESLKMVAAVNRCGGNAELTVFPQTGHGAWESVFPDPALYDWLLSHTNEECDKA